MIKMPQTMLVGLGPLGRATVEHFKRLVGQTYDELPAIKLLVLDVPQPNEMVLGGAAAPAEQTVLGPTELIELPLDELLGSLKRVQADFPWVPEKLVQAEGDDWWKTRPAARLALHAHVKELLNFFEYHMQQLGTTEVRDLMAEKGFEITTDRNEGALIVVAGLGDPIGSALLLDTTYLMHYLFRRAGLQAATTALLFMPALVPSDPATEACAYATLKELNASMDGAPYRRDYPGFTVDFAVPPFNRGCYLLDTRNERSLTLRSQAECTILAGEWLFRTTTTPLKGRIDDFVSNTGGAPDHMQGQPTAYCSLGMAAYTLPVGALVDWNANRLSAELLTSCFLKAELFSKVSSQLTDFSNKSHLRPDALMNEELRLGPDGQPIQLSGDTINRLRRLPPDQIVPQVQATLVNMRDEMLPRQKRQIDANSKRLLRDVEDRIGEEIAGILQRFPVGGLSLATQFTERLRQEATRYNGVLSRRARAYQGRNEQQANHLNRLGPALKNAVASIPPLPLAAVSFLIGIVGLLILASVWLKHILGASSPAAVIAAIAGVWIVGLAAAAYTAWRTVDGVARIQNEYVVHLDNRFQTELGLTLVNAANTLYPDILTVTDGHLQRLRRFSETISSLVRTFKARLNPEPLCGEVDFALQRSVLTPEIIEELYARYRGTDRVDAHLAALMQTTGTLDLWQTRPASDIEGDLLSFGRKVFSKMRELKAEDLLKKQLASQSQMERQISVLKDKAAPLWMYDPFSLGQAASQEARTFVGLEMSGESEMRKQFERLDPSAVFEATGDPYNITVTSIRRGMPFFGLRRAQEFRQHYLDTIRAARTPLHVDDKSALAPDLMPLRAGEQPLDAGTLVAVGRIFGVVEFDDASNQYVVRKRAKKPATHLSTDLVDAAILVGADPQLMDELTRMLQETVSEKGNSEVAEIIEAYLAEKTTAGWERERIEQYVALLRA